ncbi:MAG: hypothetical protein V4485_01510 [Pseudomonadota bacterium]
MNTQYTSGKIAMIHKSQITEQDILDFWFSDENKAKWFIKDLVFDEEIATKLPHDAIKK